MPFTISHAVLAVPLAKLTHNRLPTAAIAIGCMLPDLVHLFTRHEVIISHQWNGMIVPNLMIGLFFCFLWYLLYRPVLYRWLNLNDNLNLKHFTRYCEFILLCLVGLLLGNATHLIWDGLTHLDYRTVAFHQALATKITLYHYTFALHQVLQIACSILALPFIFYMITRYYQRHHQTCAKRATAKIFYLVLFICLAAGLYKIIEYHMLHSTLSLLRHPYFIIGESLNAFARGFLFCLALCCFVSRVIEFIQIRRNHV